MSETTLTRTPITPEEVKAIWDAYLIPSKPPSYSQLAKDFGRDRETISRHLNTPAFDAYKDDVVELKRKRATQRLAHGAEQAADDWLEASSNAAERGDHRPAKELLQAIGVVEKDGPTHNMAFQVIVGNTGQPAMPDPFDVPHVTAVDAEFSEESPNKDHVNVLTDGAVACEPG